MGKPPLSPHCLFHTFPADPLWGHWKSPFQRLALTQLGRDDSIPGSCLAHTSLSLTYNQIRVTAGGDCPPAAGAVLEYGNKGETRKPRLRFCLCAPMPTYLGKVRTSKSFIGSCFLRGWKGNLLFVLYSSEEYDSPGCLK